MLPHTIDMLEHVVNATLTDVSLELISPQ